MWANFTGKAFSREEFTARLAGMKWTDWHPVGITLHNTAGPTLAQWVESGPAHDARIRNLQSYYEGMGWHAGPHWFISRNWINEFSSPLYPGVHSRCWNATRFGIEMVGDYNAEAFNSGDGALVRDNAIFVVASLNLKFGWKAENIVFHKECLQDNHDCPGKNVVKADVIRRVNEMMQALAGGGLTKAPPAGSEGTPKPLPGAAPAPAPSSAIADLAAASPVTRYEWKDRGRSPIGYAKGMACAYARVYAMLKAGDPYALEMARADTGRIDDDALSHYSAQMRALGWKNDKAGVDTLRHLFVLLWGLGMRESGGKLGDGRDTTADNTTAETAEAGLFQQSYNSRQSTPVLAKLLSEWKKLDAIPGVGLFDVFREGAGSISGNWGSGDGADFQEICKTSPLFAVEAALLVMRSDGGKLGHWGPLRRHEAELYAPVNDLLLKVQAIVDKTPANDPAKSAPAPTKPMPSPVQVGVGSGAGAAVTGYLMGHGPLRIVMITLLTVGLVLGAWAALKWWRGRS